MEPNRKKKMLGLLLLIIGVMAVLGGFLKGTWLSLAEVRSAATIALLLMTLGCVICGCVLIVKNREKRD